MYYLATTRFNQDTLQQNIKWRETNKWSGCIYGIPIKISERIPYGSTMFILEMNNDINKIVGIGVIKNNLSKTKDSSHKLDKVYKWGNYNRYVYKSKYRIDRSDMTRDEDKIMNILDVLLFKGYRHLKRGQGITSVPKWITHNKHFDFIKFIHNMLMIRYSTTSVDEQEHENEHEQEHEHASSPARISSS